MRLPLHIFRAAVILIAAFVQLSASDRPVRILEQDMRADILEEEITVEVPISNNSAKTISGMLRLELLEPDDSVDSSIDTYAQLKSGRNRIAMRLPNNHDSNTLQWLRVRYSFQTDLHPISRGMVSLVAISPGVFEITTVTPSFPFPDKAYRVRVHTANPITHQPVGGVQVSGRIVIDDDEESPAITRTTNSSGDAILPFIFPADAQDDVALKIEARLGDQIHKSEVDITSQTVLRVVRFAITTDKPLYQPGQSFHARALMLRADRQVMPNEAVRFELVNPDDQKVFKSTRTTNEFGIAYVDWDLPEALEPGEYELRVSRSEEDEYRDPEGRIPIHVSRYDLPNFSVSAKLDRGFYLPGQNASVEIAARYLFGKELTGGSVQLVRLSGKDESEALKSELDKSGQCIFSIDLSQFHAQLSHELEPNFMDLIYAASVTDPTSGKTERRKFGLRVSRAPVHIYLSHKSVIGNRAHFCLSAYYPDGTPAECHIRIKEDPDYNRKNAGDNASAAYQLLGNIKTNRYGAAKISDLGLLDRADDHRLILEVLEKNGQRVQFEEMLKEDSQSLVHISTDKTIYKRGESILVTALAADNLPGRIAVDVTRNGIVLWNGRIRLKDHRGFTIIPYLEDFKGEVSVTIYPLDHERRYSSTPPYANRTVFFPDPSALKLSIRLDRQSHQPGDAFSALIHTGTASGAPVRSALGAVIVDNALYERALSDPRLESNPSEPSQWDWLYSSGSVGGVTRSELAGLDLTAPLPDGLDLAAELLLSVHNTGYVPSMERHPDHGTFHPRFLTNMRQQLEPVRKALLNQDVMGWEFATNSTEATRILRKAGIDINAIRDPWDMAYHFRFSVDQRLRKAVILSAGPDKRIDTTDDIYAEFLEWNYFLPYGKLIDRAVKEAHAASGSFIRDFRALSAALAQRGLDLKNLLDPWGNPYQFTFEVNGPSYDINVYSNGPVNGCCRFSVWSSSIDYFENARSNIAAALDKNIRTNYSYPLTDESFDKILSDSGVLLRRLLDPWGHPYSVKLSYEPEYTDRRSWFADNKVQHASSNTGRLAWIRIFSCGPDGRQETGDDFLVAGFSKDLLIQNGKDFKPRPLAKESADVISGSARVLVTDPSGAIVTGAVVIATMQNSHQQYRARSDSDGSYAIHNMPGGVCDIWVFYPSFVITLVRDVPIQTNSLTSVNASLVIDTSSQTITVTAETQVLLLESSSSVGTVISSQSLVGTQEQNQQMFTPRLRDYFPETLYWEPSIITDANGSARIKLKLADNITTWRMTVLASTKSGELAVGEKEIEVFQPFFIEHEPPKVLTVGDEIDLPVIVRNYLPKAQQVNIEMKPASWFDLMEPSRKTLSINAGESKSIIMPFTASNAARNGKQQVYAANRTIGDAVEKTVRVHPYGKEMHAMVSGYLDGESANTIFIDADLMPGSQNAQLKIYPNALAHVGESIEASLIRPYGCGEQTTSSTYPSLMLLKYYGEAGKGKGPLQNKAENYLKLGYKRLLNYREPDGGFSYYGNGSPDVALTAYILRFLQDASEFIDVNSDIIQEAEEWLSSMQRSDGSWASNQGARDDSLTAYVALALTIKDGGKAHADSVSRALKYLSDRPRFAGNPYALAAFALASSAAGNKAQATAALNQLSKHAIADRGGFYWKSEEVTPFSGWGFPGSIEKTAMAVLAFSNAGLDAPDFSQFAAGGTRWLMGNKDQYGIWYSGQATVLALQAILKNFKIAEAGMPKNQIAVFVNGQPVHLAPASLQSDAPAILDISGLVKAGENRIKIKGDGKFSAGCFQAVVDYYVPWANVPVEKGIPPMKVSFDRTDANVGDRIVCSVELGNMSGYGMMIGEIGLPPGADIDRAELDKAMKSNKGISRYDVLPDRLVLYLESDIVEYRVSFSFCPRYALRAYSAPSMRYFYYNPDYQVVLPPQKFNIRTASGKGADVEQ